MSADLHTDNTELHTEPHELHTELHILPAESRGIADRDTLTALLREVVSPMLSAMAQMIERNTAALEQLAAAQKIQSDRMEALEKQTRLQTPVTATQAKLIADAVRVRAIELLTKREETENGFYPQRDRKGVNRLCGIIRKSILARYGIGKLAELPRCEYEVAIAQAAIWNDLRTVRELAREIRTRTEESTADAHTETGLEHA